MKLEDEVREDEIRLKKKKLSLDTVVSVLGIEWNMSDR